jgi:hypothetical protein
VNFLTELFGGSDNMWLTAIFALGIVIVLIVFGSYLLKLLTGGSARPGRSRNRRLGVVETLSIDPKRTLLIVRRDDVDHLILTGGPADVVIETGITVDASPQRVATPPARPAAQSARPAPVAANSPPLPVPPQRQPEPVAPPQKSATISTLDRIRNFGKPSAESRAAPRHPGLIRPAGRPDPQPVPLTPVDNAANRQADSAKDVVEPKSIEQPEFEDSNAQARAEGRPLDRT